MKFTLITAALCFCIACSNAFGADSGSTTKIVIQLKGNTTTGYSWTYSMEPEGVVKELSYEYRQDAPNMIGSGGTSVFTFEGIQSGQTTLTFRYARPWESSPPQTLTYIVTVDKKQRIQIKKK